MRSVCCDQCQSIFDCLKKLNILKGEIMETIVSALLVFVSHQLKTLRENRLVKYRKEGNVVYYSLDDDHVHVLITQAMNHIKHK